MELSSRFLVSLKCRAWLLDVLGRSQACAVTSLPVMRSFLPWKVAEIVRVSMIKSQCLSKRKRCEKDLKSQTVLLRELVFGTQNWPSSPETEVHQQFLNRAGHSLQQLLIDFDLSKNAGGPCIGTLGGKMGKRGVSWLKARVFWPFKFWFERVSQGWSWRHWSFMLQPHLKRYFGKGICPAMFRYHSGLSNLMPTFSRF